MNILYIITKIFLILKVMHLQFCYELSHYTYTPCIFWFFLTPCIVVSKPNLSPSV